MKQFFHILFDAYCVLQACLILLALVGIAFCEREARKLDRPVPTDPDDTHQDAERPTWPMETAREKHLREAYAEKHQPSPLPGSPAWQVETRIARGH